MKKIIVGCTSIICGAIFIATSVLCFGLNQTMTANLMLCLGLLAFAKGLVLNIMGFKQKDESK